MILKKIIKFFVALVLWVLTIFFGVTVLLYMPHVSAFISLSVTLLIVPIKKWQDLIGKVIDGKVKALIVVFLFLIMIPIVPTDGSTTENGPDNSPTSTTNSTSEDIRPTDGGDIQNTLPIISRPGDTLDDPIVVTVDEFANDINTDISLAKDRYDGKYIRITGEIKQIVDGGIMTGYYLYGNRGDDGLRVVCWKDGDPQKDVLEGKPYTFLGVIREITTTNATEIAECVIVSQEDQDVG